MSNFEADLSAILSDDPLGLLKLSTAEPRPSSDQRLVDSFQEVNSFFESNNREPRPTQEVFEYMLYSRLRAIRESADKVFALRAHDKHGLLSGHPLGAVGDEQGEVEDLLRNDPLGLLSADPEEEQLAAEILTLRHVKGTKGPKLPDRVARRKPCKDFDQFEPLFKEIHADLKSGKRVTIPAGQEGQVKPGAIFVLKGSLVYVPTVGTKTRSVAGKENARTYCVFENGTEADMLARSLTTALLKSPNSRQVVVSCHDYEQETGFIYVLKSLSKAPHIAAIKNLFKIGFTTQSVEERVKRAENEPTCLMAPVRVVATFQTINVNPQRLENLLHQFFSSACLDIEIDTSDGGRYAPREWFLVPYFAIETAIELFLSGELADYRYDRDLQDVVSR